MNHAHPEQSGRAESSREKGKTGTATAQRGAKVRLTVSMGKGCLPYSHSMVPGGLDVMS